MKKTVLICTIILALLLVCLTGCGNEKGQILSGSYTAEGILNQMNYTFDENNLVTVRFLVGGYPVSAQSGTYKLNKDGSIITFDFSSEEDRIDSHMVSLGGVFSFKKEEDCIWIGTVCYKKDSTGIKSGEAEEFGLDILSSNISTKETIWCMV